MSKDQARLDEYQDVAFYKNNAKKREKGFSSFTSDGTPYFAYFQDGNIALISQSYKAASGRDNGIKSTTKNMQSEKNYRFHKHANGKYYYGIVAGNGQEVAVSVWYASEAAARASAERAMGKRRAATKPKAKTKKAAPVKAAAVKAKRKVSADHDNYHPLAFYSSQTKGSPKNGIETFKGSDGLYYFVYNENGKIALISEGYPTVAARETGAASVRKNLPIEKRYQHRKLKNGKHDYKLKAGNGREIARSVWYGSAATALTGAAYLAGTRKRSAAKPKAAPKKKVSAAPVAAAAIATAAAAGAAKTATAKPADRDDDYLKCEEYHNRTVTDKANNVALFKHSNGQYYFVLYDDNGGVRLRSEGFPDTAKRNNELSGVLRLKDKKDSYKKIEKNGYVMDVLYDETGREVGRSCLRKIAPVVAAAPIAAAAVPAAAAATTGGFSWGWLKWLLPLLLLALLLLGWKNCSAPTVPAIPEVDTAAIAAQAKAKADAAAAETARLAAEAAERTAAAARRAAMGAPAAMAAPIAMAPLPPVTNVTPQGTIRALPVTTAGLNICGPSSVAIFNVTPNMTPRPITVLGTNPEFGNSHGLSPRQFHDKLTNSAAASGYDRTYLNYVARSLGYDNFTSIPLSAFSEESLAYGTTGLLGFGQAHAYDYHTLNTSPRDREAFRINGVNGQVVHFMKTCGNYMYACQ